MTDSTTDAAVTQWRMVPVEPTQAMRERGTEIKVEVGCNEGTTALNWEEAAKVWSAMLAASPAPAQVGEGEPDPAMANRPGHCSDCGGKGRHAKDCSHNRAALTTDAPDTRDAAGVKQSLTTDGASDGNAPVPAGMKPWRGGEHAPSDWDGGPVLRRNGEMLDNRGRVLDWRHFAHLSHCADGEGDIIAYTPKPDASEGLVERLQTELEEAVEHLGNVLGADPGPRANAVFKAARDWWTAFDERDLAAHQSKETNHD